MDRNTMTRIRTLLPALALVALVGAPTSSEAQLSVSDNCFSGLTGPCSFFLFNTGSPMDLDYRPIELAFLEIDLLGGWEFGSTTATGYDVSAPFFGPIAPVPASFGGSAASLALDFLSALNDDPCFPYDGVTCSNVFGFAVGDAFSPPTYVDLTVDAPAGATAPEYAWRATDIDGTVYRSGPMPGEVVPEPSTWVMLLTGLLGIGFFTYRRREADAGATG